MAVGSLIGYEKNGIVHSVYCYEYGEPENMGQLLLENYNLGNIEELVKIGDFHKLESSAEETKKYTYDDEYEEGAPINVRDYSSSVEFFNDDEEDNDWFYLLDEDGNWYVFNKLEGEEEELLEELI
jgi:hypothetical protein